MTKANKPGQSLGDHLRELRQRLMFVAVFFGLASGIGYLLREQITFFILKPLNLSVYYTSPQGGLEFFMRVIITVGIIGAVPAMVYQLAKFVEPAFATTMQPKFIRKKVVLSIVLALSGVAFGYLVMLPMSLKFFADFAGTQLKPLISANDYLTFVLGMLATFAAVFQLPLIISIIDHIKPLKPKDLMRYQRHVIIAALVVAVLLPFTYDPVTQFIIAVPIVLLYELSILFVWTAHRKAAATRIEPHYELFTKLEPAQITPQTAQAPKAVPQPFMAHQHLVDSVRIQPGHILDLRTHS